MAKKSAEALSIIDREALRTLKDAVNKALVDLGKQYGVVFEATKGHFTNANTGDMIVNIAIAGKAGVSAAAILGAENWKLYAGRFGLDKNLLGAEFLYKGVVCKVTGLAPTRRAYPVQVDMDGKPKLFPASMVSDLCEAYAAKSKRATKPAKTKLKPAKKSLLKKTRKARV